MTFAHPALLWLVASAGVPIAIHWLAGRWAPVEPWAAMRFLTAVTPARRRSELRDRLVLAARVAALAAVA
ncbi:BatA domain-containing protein, partial [Alienimonas chondri]|uniref:BatA domain-containing protein n=1 Tax=Alienimonas chondri TaxID=2681879 RepID=UPI0014894464